MAIKYVDKDPVKTADLGLDVRQIEKRDLAKGQKVSGTRTVAGSTGGHDEARTLALDLTPDDATPPEIAVMDVLDEHTSLTKVRRLEIAREIIRKFNAANMRFNREKRKRAAVK
jgi:hypothetical protein